MTSTTSYDTLPLSYIPCRAHWEIELTNLKAKGRETQHNYLGLVELDFSVPTFPWCKNLEVCPGSKDLS